MIHRLARTLAGEGAPGPYSEPDLPNPGSWCIVDVVERDGSMRRLGIVHSDPRMQERADRLMSRWPPSQGDILGLPRMRVSPSSEVVAHVPEALVAEIARGEENIADLRALGLDSFVVVPLHHRGGLIGAVTFVKGEPGGGFDRESVAVAEGVAAQCGIVLGAALDRREGSSERVEWKEIQQRLVAVNERLLISTLREHEHAEEAERASEAKSHFLASVSHEIRAPINAMIGYMDLLEISIAEPTATQREYFIRMRASSRHLISLIDELLDLARIESGRTELSEDIAPAGEAMSDAADEIEPQARSAGVSLDATPSDGSPLYRADPDRVRQILIILLSNAVKFSHTAGRVAMSCGSTGNPDPEATLPGSGPWTFLRVEDTGIGIPPEKTRSVFKPFVQLAEEGRGTGLGLVIALELARKMGGDLTLRSVPGQGSCFTLWLPNGDPQHH